MGMVILTLKTDNQTRGRFALLVIYINMEKPLISRVFFDGAVQNVEYEALLTVCFTNGKYGHVKETCPTVVTDLNLVVPQDNPSIGVDSSNGGKSNGDSMVSKSREKDLKYGL
ncbi:hypothetical protein J1N35_040378 [Gossypium stocksii]|uniref:Zinc knuckle CX2CX4HX4C domain-containing protein n=1 Tax=Gossypium stocksii TaxID=47602 RepID=A0A9D3ZHM2_9ROSI|nr:hypothetical protein J1N35_040378 [Gossypium stocksii]